MINSFDNDEAIKENYYDKNIPPERELNEPLPTVSVPYRIIRNKTVDQGEEEIIYEDQNLDYNQDIEEDIIAPISTTFKGYKLDTSDFAAGMNFRVMTAFDINIDSNDRMDFIIAHYGLFIHYICSTDINMMFE